MPLPLFAAGASVAGILGSIGSSIANIGTQSLENSKNRAFQAQQAELAYQRQVELMNMQNAYNAPSAQMERYAQAGLNPNLIYSQNQPSASAPSVASASSGASSAATFNNPFNELFANYMAVRSMDADEAVKESEVKANEARSLLYASQIENINSDTERKRFDLEYNKKVEKYRLELEAIGLGKARAEKIAQLHAARKLYLQNLGIEYNNEFLRRTLEPRIYERNLGGRYVEAQIDYLSGLNNLNKEQKTALELANEYALDERVFRKQFLPDGTWYFTNDYIRGASHRVRNGLPKDALTGVPDFYESRNDAVKTVASLIPWFGALGFAGRFGSKVAEKAQRSTFPIMYDSDGRPIYGRR